MAELAAAERSSAVNGIVPILLSDRVQCGMPAWLQGMVSTLIVDVKGMVACLGTTSDFNNVKVIDGVITNAWLASLGKTSNVGSGSLAGKRPFRPLYW